MFLAMLIFLLAAILALEAPRLLKNKRWGELGAFLFLWALAAFLSGAAVLGAELPNPTDLLTAVFGL
ncbi:MAG: hypothetical protein DDT21_00032 [Syntrophomonadaceae bacterium]|nr:hypothetical protein [Bacillota bacterium]